jgi:hypothetical protein
MTKLIDVFLLSAKTKIGVFLDVRLSMFRSHFLPSSSGYTVSDVFETLATLHQASLLDSESSSAFIFRT